MLGSTLALGNLRWLTIDGRLLSVTEDDVETEQSIRHVEHDWDLELCPGGGAVRLTDMTRPYWEDAARRAGYDLDDLLNARRD